VNTPITPTAHQHKDSFLMNLYLDYSGLDNHAVKELPLPPNNNNNNNNRLRRLEVLLQRSCLFASPP